MKKIKIIFISFLESKEHFSKYQNLSIAGVNYQSGLLNEMIIAPDIDLRVINITPIPIFPKGSVKINQKSREIDGILVEDVGFLNLPFLKSFTIRFNLERSIKKLLKRESFNTIISFNYLSIYRTIAYSYPSKFDIKYIPILADLPIKYSSKVGLALKFKIFIYNHVLTRQLKMIKLAILLNSNARQMIAPDANYIVIEGGVTSKSFPPAIMTQATKKVFLYSGTLDEYSGVNIMAQAFLKIIEVYDDVSLEIYGFGDYQDYLSELLLKNSKIKYNGVINKEALIDKQKNSFCLVNPKLIHHPVSLMTFPSKIHEYMMSMRPILSTRMSGIDSKYFDNMYIIEGDQVIDYVNGFKAVLDSSNEELSTISKNAYQFLEEEKNWHNQVKKIVNLVS